MQRERSSLSDVDWSRRTEPQLLPEWMDEPSTYEDFLACLRDLKQVNRLFRGYAPTLRFLEQAVRRAPVGQTLRVLDIGCGGGDALARIHAWALRHGHKLELTGIDLNSHAVRASRETHAALPIRWVEGDAFSYTGAVDVVLSALLCHHLPSEQVVRFLAWMDATATIGWCVNDLERSARSAKLFRLAARLFRWHRFVQHDGPVSFARSFSYADWTDMLSRASVPPSKVQLTRSFPSRLCVQRFQ